MNIRKLSEDVYAAGQIAAHDIPALAAQGFRSIVCNRPDGESSGQPAAREIEAAAKKHKLEFRYVPIGHGPSGQAAEDFRAALDEMPKPLLAYCRSGARSSMLYSSVTSQGGGGFSLARLLGGFGGKG